MTDQRSLDALDVAERHAIGQATEKELSAAWAAARGTVGVTARVAVRDAAWVAARVAVGDAVRAAAWDAARDIQKKKFLEVCEEV